MSVRPFPVDYESARSEFIRCADYAGSTRKAFLHPSCEGRTGEPLSVDIARLGVPNPPNLLVILSGMHGVELPAGSALQSEWMRNHSHDLPEHLGVVLLHAVNAFGCSAGRRVNEDNVDLCRNFVDFSCALPTNSGYEQLADSINGADGAVPVMEAMEAFESGHDPATLLAAVMGGQYVDPTGFSYGGHARTWSANVLSEVLRLERHGPERVVIVDIHSGVGPRGELTPVCLQAVEAVDRARLWLNQDVHAPCVAEQLGQALHSASGHPTREYESIFVGSELTSLVFEFGTVAPSESLPVLLEEHFQHQHGEDDLALDDIRKIMWEQHSPSDTQWQEAVLARGLSAIRKIVDQLSQEGI